MSFGNLQKLIQVFVLLILFTLLPLHAFSGLGGGTEVNPYQITSVEQLQEMQDGMFKHFILMNDINAAVTQTWNAGKGFAPIDGFYGSIHGKGYVIDSLYIHRPDGIKVGLIGHGSGATIDSLWLENINITGSINVGGIVGQGFDIEISNSYTTGFVKGVGKEHENSIDGVGGIVGSLFSESLISQSYSTCYVSSTRRAGGIAGDVYQSEIENSYFTGVVAGSEGGIAGDLRGSPYGSTDKGKITHSYVIGGRALLEDYSSLDIPYTRLAGGYIEEKEVVITQSFWNIGSTGLDTVSTGVGKLTDDLKKTATFTDWEFSTVWQINELVSFPVLINTPHKPVMLHTADTISQGVAITIELKAIDFSAGALDSFVVVKAPKYGTAIITGNDLTYTTDADYVGRVDIMVQAINGSGVTSSFGVATFLITPDYPGGDGSLISPYEITTLRQLAGMRYDLGAHYVLANTINAAATRLWEDGGFKPIGYWNDPFTGSFNGSGFVIDSLWIERPSENFIGLFSEVAGGTIDSCWLENVTIKGNAYVGAITGELSDGGSITHSYSTGKIVGKWEIGGLVGAARAGYNFTGSSGGITESYSTVHMQGEYTIGGIAGSVGNKMELHNTYFTGVMSGNRNVGGVVGLSNAFYSFSAGKIIPGLDGIGGVAGGWRKEDTLTHSFWNSEYNTFPDSGGVAKTSIEMKDSLTYSAWDFDTVWQIKKGVSYPGLQNVRNIPIAGHLLDTFAYAAEKKIHLVASDVDEGALDSFVVAEQPLYGNASISGSELTYVPDAGFSGPVILYYRAINSAGIRGNSARIEIHIQPQFPGGDGSEGSPYLIENVFQLQSIMYGLDKQYALANDIDASNTRDWHEGRGFLPMGDEEVPFSGSLNGRGFSIGGLFINSGQDSSAGLFGIMDSAVIDSLLLENGDITALKKVGALAGMALNSTVQNTSVMHYSIVGDTLGGVVGTSVNTIFEYVESQSSLSPDYRFGGIVASASNTVINRCMAKDSILRDANHYGMYRDGGGIAGYIGDSSIISESFSESFIEESRIIGGIAGTNDASIIVNSYFQGIMGDRTPGGIAGKNIGAATILNSYSLGSVHAFSGVGGISFHTTPENIILNCFWIESYDDAIADAGTKKTYDQMFDVATYTDLDSSGLDTPWDFVGNPNDDSADNDIWIMLGVYEPPELTWRVNILRYRKGDHGTIDGDMVQALSNGEDGSRVEVDASTGYRFVQWSDGSTENPRVDSAVNGNIDVTAEYEVVSLSSSEDALPVSSSMPLSSVLLQSVTTQESSSVGAVLSSQISTNDPLSSAALPLSSQNINLDPLSSAALLLSSQGINQDPLSSNSIVAPIVTQPHSSIENIILIHPGMDISTIHSKEIEIYTLQGKQIYTLPTIRNRVYVIRIVQ